MATTTVLGLIAFAFLAGALVGGLTVAAILLSGPQLGDADGSANAGESGYPEAWAPRDDVQPPHALIGYGWPEDGINPRREALPVPKGASSGCRSQIFGGYAEPQPHDFDGRDGNGHQPHPGGNPSDHPPGAE